MGCHWGFEMLCQEIGCQNGIKLHTPVAAEPKPKPEEQIDSTGATGTSSSSETGSSSSITGGTTDDEAAHIRSVEQTVNGWSTGTGTTGGTGAATGGSETGAETGTAASGGATGSSFVEEEQDKDNRRTSLLVGRNRNARKFN